MTKKDEKTKEPKPKKTAAKKSTTTTRRTTASGTKEKKAQTTRKSKQTSPTSASAAWKGKKAEVRQRSKEPKTLAERKALQEHGPVRRFFMNHTAALDLAVILPAGFAALCLYSIASDNQRPAALWCVRISKSLFGDISPIFYFLVIALAARIWMRNIKRFKKVHYLRYLYFLGVFFFLALGLEYNAVKHVPPLPAEDNGGRIAEAIVLGVTNVLGNSGMLILLIFLILFLLWHAWRFIAAREKESSRKEEEVPVRVYWENIHTAAEAEAEEAKANALTSDIEADFRSSMGLLTAQEETENEKRTSLRENAENSLRKLRDTFQEISQPIPDKDAMVPKEPPSGARTVSQSVSSPALKAETKKPTPPAAKKNGKRSAKTNAPTLPLIPESQEGEPAEEIPEPIFEEEPDHNGSGLLSAPADPPQPVEEKPAEQPGVQVRTHKVVLDEEAEMVVTTPQHDYSFVPTLPEDDGKAAAADAGKNEDPWILPDLQQILDPIKHYKGSSPDDPAILAQSEKIERLLDTFGAPSKVVDIQCGPTFSQFGVEPGFVERSGRKTRVRIKQIEMLQKDLEMELSVKQLAIEAPIPGKTYVGLQVQNKTRTPVSLREVIESEDFRGRKRELGIALGKDINGATFGADLTRMPHLLIAGATGSGKSVCLNAILSCLLLHHSPEQLKLVLVDPKRVELTGYNGIPHLITPVVTDMEQVGNVLQWVLREMDMRNLHFMENGVRNIQDYNRKFANKKLPYIVVVIDELANLMMEAASDIENSIVRLAQTARAMGIHLIVATQRPSRDVITGTIKGNLPTRIAFAVASYVDSQVILDRAGAENLFGKGDMYFLSTEETSLKRLQCVYVSDNEIHRIVEYWKSNPRRDTAEEEKDPDLVYVPQPVTEKVIRMPEITNGTLTQLPLFNEPAPPLKKDGDLRYDEAVNLVQRSGRASANLLVSKMSIGYSRANKLLARMEEEGIIGPPNPNPAIPREILDYGKYGPEDDGEKD